MRKIFLLFRKLELAFDEEALKKINWLLDFVGVEVFRKCKYCGTEIAEDNYYNHILYHENQK